MSGICPDISIYKWGGGVVYPICPYAEKQINRVNLGLKRHIFMSKTHMSLCVYVLGNAPMIDKSMQALIL